MGGCCGLQYLVEADGSVYPCDFYGLDGYCLGNIRQNSWAELDLAREKTGFIEASRQVPEVCGRCQWYPLCRNGCRRDRLVEQNDAEHAVTFPKESHPIPCLRARFVI